MPPSKIFFDKYRSAESGTIVTTLFPAPSFFATFSDANTAAPPLEPSFARSPEVLHTAFLVVAAVLSLVGAALVVTGLWPPSLLAERRRRRLSPLELSLLLAEAAAREDDEAARRRTLDDLATRLGEVPSPSLERRTRALAWGQSAPDPEAVAVLAEQVRSTPNGGPGAR